jgi:outer membrane protein assembly factor BamB
MGHLHCYDASSGSNVWQKNLLEDYKTKPPVWGYAASMLVDGDKVITLAGGKGSAVVALDKNSGKELWRALTALEVGYSPPSIIEAAGKRQIIVWLDVSVNALDPETGKTLWSIEFPSAATLQRPIVSIVPPVKFGNHLFFSEFYQGSMLLELDQQKPGARVVWQTKENNPTKPTDLNAIMTTPIIRDGHIYGIGGSGEMRCLKLETGAVVWESLKATGGKKALFAHAFIIPQGDRYVIFNDQGDLILANLTPQGYAEIDKAHLLDTTFATRGREVVWCHPAFANRCLYLHNDKEMICVSMAKEEKPKENKGT